MKSNNKIVIDVNEYDNKPSLKNKNEGDNIHNAIKYNKEFEEIKVYPKNRMFNSFLIVFLFVGFVFLGIIIGCLLIIFA